MANIPSNLSYGTVTGRFLLAYADSADIDDPAAPDAVPATGTVYFTPSPLYIKDTGASPVPVTILPATVSATLDSEGYLCGYGTTRGIVLMATDDTDGQPSGWTWEVEYRFKAPDGSRVNTIAPFSFSLPGGTTVDLTTVTPATSSNGTFYQAQGPAGADGVDGAAATIVVGTVTTGAAGSSATVTNSGTSSAAIFDFTIPRGATGNTGPTGPANTLEIGTVTSGTTPSATITGTAPNQILNLVLAKGDTGDQGPAGSLDNLNVVAPIAYDSLTSTLSLTAIDGGTA